MGEKSLRTERIKVLLAAIEQLESSKRVIPKILVLKPSEPRIIIIITAPTESNMNRFCLPVEVSPIIALAKSLVKIEA